MQNTRNTMQNTTTSGKRDEFQENEKVAPPMGRESINMTGPTGQQTFDSSFDGSMYIEDESYYSSSYYGSSFNDSNEMCWQPSGASMDHTRNAGNSEPRRNSVLLTPAGMLGMTDVDFDDSDDDDGSGPKKKAPATAPGDPNHRPMVGGFAAAAYEAARADHYKKQQENKKESSV